MALLDNLIAYWKFDENSGTSVADSVGGFNGTWTGTLGGAQWGTGEINSGGVFNGTDRYVTTGSKSFGLGTSVSLSLWVNPTTLTTTTYYCWFSFGGYITGGWILQKAGDGSFPLRLAWNGTDYYDGPVFSTTGSWSHIVIVISAGVPQTFYVNNVATTATRGTGSGTFSATDPQSVDIGRRGDNTQFINGSADEIGLFNKALSAAEVASLYNGGAGYQYPFGKLPTVFNNYQFISVGDGMSVSEKIR